MAQVIGTMSESARALTPSNCRNNNQKQHAQPHIRIQINPRKNVGAVARTRFEGQKDGRKDERIHGGTRVISLVLLRLLVILKAVSFTDTSQGVSQQSDNSYTFKKSTYLGLH